MGQFGASQKIVIVEDNLELSDIYKTRLELLGYEVFAAYDGIQALMVIRDEMPDLVLLDLMVPKKAGDQILEEMRESEWGKNIKVMVISNLNESEAPAGLRNLGIEGYAVKANLSNDQLDQLVDAILKPAGQVDDVVLQQQSNAVQVTVTPHQDVPVVADPYSGTRLQSAAAPQATAPAAPPVAPTAPHATDLHATPTTVPITTSAMASVVPSVALPPPPTEAVPEAAELPAVPHVVPTPAPPAADTVQFSQTAPTLPQAPPVA